MEQPRAGRLRAIEFWALFGTFPFSLKSLSSRIVSSKSDGSVRDCIASLFFSLKNEARGLVGVLGALGSLIAGTTGTGGAGEVLLATGVATGEVATKGFVARDADEDTTVTKAPVGGADARDA